LVTETELYAGSPSRRGRHAAQKKASLDNWLRDLTELKIGDPVVHELSIVQWVMSLSEGV
jgi:transcription-repair coupling factor (superfamily II helicase)